MIVTIKPQTGCGTVTAPPSKSAAHRLLIGAGLAAGKESTVRPVALSGDMRATLACLSALGATVTLDGDAVTVIGIDPSKRTVPVTLPCGESGSTLRFFLPLAMLSDAPCILTGSKRLMERPLEIYEKIAEENGISLIRDSEKITCVGKLKTHDFTVRGDISSQFITGLLFALPFLGGGSVTVLPPIESLPYLHLTVSLLNRCGIHIAASGDTVYTCPPNAAYRAGTYTVEGDESNAAFFRALRALGDDIKLDGCNPDTVQGDACAKDMLERLSSGYTELNLAQCPDLAPILFAAAAALHGGTFIGVERLRYKESDRIQTMREVVEKFGATLTVTQSRVTVTPPKDGLHAPSFVDSHNDHRVAMASAVLLTRTGGVLHHAEAVNKSYPDFFTVLCSLGYNIQITP